MKKFLPLLLLVCSLAHGQNQTTYGQSILTTGGGSTPTGTSPNFFAPNLISVNVPTNVTDGYMWLGTGGTSGNKMDFIITQQTSFGAQATSVQCHSTYTITGATINAWIHYTFTGCTLSAGYWYIGYSTNDAAIGQGIWTCYTGTCVTGSTNQSNTGNSGAWYIAQTYGTYSGNQTVMTQISGSQQSLYIVGTPVTLGQAAKLKSGTF